MYQKILDEKPFNEIGCINCLDEYIRELFPEAIRKQTTLKSPEGGVEFPIPDGDEHRTYRIRPYFVELRCSKLTNGTSITILYGREENVLEVEKILLAPQKLYTILRKQLIGVKPGNVEQIVKRMKKKKRMRKYS